MLDSGHFPERRYKMLVYGGLEEVSKHATELISTKLQSSAINTISARTLIHINSCQQSVYKLFLNYNISIR